MEQRNYNNKKISQLTTAEGKSVSQDGDILEELLKFYESLYTADSSICSNDAFEPFTENIRRNLPKLSEDKKVELERRLTLEECRKALMAFGNGKSPGGDGVNVEFYKCFFDLFGQEFLDSVNAAYEGNELSVSQGRGVITLIPKEGFKLKNAIKLEANYFTKCRLQNCLQGYCNQN